MDLHTKIFYIITSLSLIRSHIHDEIPKCSLTRVYRERQTLIESPNYPHNYKAGICWDYVVRSPYKCPTTFHIQFLDFYLEFSKDCKNDYLAIGLENIDADMDVLCGQVVGIKKYRTPNGVLRLRFVSSESAGSTGKGFKLLVTRLACEREEILRDLKDQDNDSDNDDTIRVLAPSNSFQLPELELMQVFRNLTGQEQHQMIPLPPLFAFNYPTQLPSPPHPVTGTVYLPSNEFPSLLPNYPGVSGQNSLQPPCTTEDRQQEPYYYTPPNGNQLTYPINIAGNNPAYYLPSSYIGSISGSQALSQQAGVLRTSNHRYQFVNSGSPITNLPRSYDNTLDSLEACCVSAFQQKHFYLSSPGFPRTIFSNILPSVQKQDCVFRLEKSAANVCRLRLDFKFFDFGQTARDIGNIGLAAIENTQNVCREDFIEIDDQRFCGCRSDYSFAVNWLTAADKKLRMRLGYSGVTSGGFLLELTQEECSETQFDFMSTERPQSGSISATRNPNPINDQLFNPQQLHNFPLGQQPQNLHTDSYPTQQYQHHHNSQGGVNGGVNYNGQQSYLQNPLQPPTYFGQQQHLPNTAGGIPNILQQQNPFLTQNQQQLQSLQYNNLYPSKFGTNYFSYLTPPQNPQHNFLQQPGLTPNPFYLPQLRNARSFGHQQPVTVVETNSTRKEYYYSDNNSSNYNENSSLLSRSNSAATSYDWDRKDTIVNENVDSTDNVARQRRKCSFDMGDVLRLSIDILWITKPICYAPQRNWFTNWIG